MDETSPNVASDLSARHPTHPAAAYVLGVLCVSGRAERSGLSVTLRGDGEPFVSLLWSSIDPGAEHTFTLEKERLYTSALSPSGIASVFGASEFVPETFGFPAISGELARHFCRGVFDGAARISSPRSPRLLVRLPRPSEALTAGILSALGVPPRAPDARHLTWEGSAALDLLGRLYEGFHRRHPARSEDDREPEELALTPVREKHLRRYRAWCSRIVGLASDGAALPILKVERLRPDAVLPGKERVSDSGYDLTLLYEKARHGPVVLYGTGIVVEPPDGWYLDVVARSSIIKRGYLVANSVGVIDRAYRGELLVPLAKLDPAAPDLELPARVVQMIPRPIVHFPVEESSATSPTHRGSGGFGSSGV